jgi:hypothetical protein
MNDANILDRAHQWINMMTLKMTQQENELALLQKEKDLLQNKYDTIIRERDILKQENNMATMKNDILLREKDILQQEKDILQQEKDTLQQEKDTLQQEKDTLQQKYEQIKLNDESVSSASLYAKKLEDDFIVVAHDKTQEYIAEINSLKQMIHDLRSQNIILDQKLTTAISIKNSNPQHQTYQKQFDFDSISMEIERLLQVINSAVSVMKTQFSKIISDTTQQSARILPTPRSLNLFTSRSQQMFTEIQPQQHHYLIVQEIDKFIQVIESSIIITQTQIERIMDEQNQPSNPNFRAQMNISGQFVPPLNLQQVATAPPAFVPYVHNFTS